MIERAFARTLRNYSTIFFVVAILTFPVHTLYAFAFKDVIATSRHHDVIAAGEDGRRVGTVRPEDLDTARVTFWIVTIAELALLPLAIRATRRVFVTDQGGGIPTATDAWRAALSPGREPLPESVPPAAIAAGLVAAVVVGGLVHLITTTATAFLTDGARWVGLGLGQGLVRASAVPLVLGPIALFRAKEGGSSAPKF